MEEHNYFTICHIKYLSHEKNTVDRLFKVVEKSTDVLNELNFVKTTRSNSVSILKIHTSNLSLFNCFMESKELSKFLRIVENHLIIKPRIITS